MNRYRRAIRKDREARAKAIHAPKTDEDRVYHTHLAIYDAMFKAALEVEGRGLEGQDRARFIDRKAGEAATMVAEIWKAEE